MVLSSCVHMIVIDELATFVVNLAMASIALVSAICAFCAYRHQRNRSKKDAACKLASQYADVILEKFGIVGSIYGNTKLDEYIKSTINFNEIQNFDNTELNSLLKGKTTREEFDERLSKIDPKAILFCRIARVSSQSDRDRLYADYVEVEEDGTREIKNASFLVFDFLQDITDLLNQLECFCMSCRYGLADEELLYQSLHKTFLSTVWLLYPTISSKNINEEDKTYTNVIWLFVKWRKRLTGIKEKAEKEKKSHEMKAAKAMAKGAKEQAKADKVRPKVHSGKRI